MRNLDCFCAVPSGQRRAELVELDVPFGEELVHYAVGAASCAVPGVPAGLDALWRAHGRLPWARPLRPGAAAGARRRADAACARRLPRDARAGDDDARGRADLRAQGRLLRPGERLEQPGLVHALELVADEGAASVYRGSIAESLLELVSTSATVSSRARIWRRTRRSWASLSRSPTPARGSSPAAGWRASLPHSSACLGSPASTGPRALALLDALDDEGPEAHTTNLVTVDREGSACVLTTSLGLGSGDWVPASTCI